ncbi:DNA polymerase III subunit delta' [Selenomonadales bacterium OttesenSCG-928-I06]|nr:DNA polymerase III subunit delta' [Selenomonadales bacterium OttesenSCG-928-I06]
MNFDSVIGHEKSIQFLKNLIKKEQIPHALLFSGPDGIGKKLCAEIFAKSILCNSDTEKPCNSCQSCLSYDNNTHPDFKSITTEDGTDTTTIKIEQIRELKSYVSLIPVFKKGRVCIIDNAQKMTVQASNSILKLLEEPPDNNYFILITPFDDQLLETITSRCLKIDFQSINKNLLFEHLNKKDDCNQEKLKTAISLSNGRFKKTLELLEPDGLALRDFAAKFLQELSTKRLDLSSNIINELAELNQKNANSFLDYLDTLIRDLLIIEASTENLEILDDLVNRDLHNTLKEISHNWNHLQLLKAHSYIKETMHIIKNSTLRLAFESLVIKLNHL